MNTNSEIDPFSMFELDANMDFETAYQMISNFEPMNDDKHFGIMEPDHLKADHQMAIESPVLKQDNVFAHTGDLLNFKHTSVIGNELLSTLESSAIENFLDNLISGDGTDRKEFSNQPPQEGHFEQATQIHNEINIQHNVTINSDPHFNHNNISHHPVQPSLHQTHQSHGPPMTHSLPTVEEKVSTLEFINPPPEITKNMHNDEYNPPDLIFPDIRIEDDDIPPNVAQDIKLLKKWKHVEIEKLRRNHTKKMFDELTNMVRSTSEKKGKRVPKHLLLSNVVKDIRELMAVNQQLEQILHNDI